MKSPFIPAWISFLRRSYWICVFVKKKSATQLKLIIMIIISIT